MATWLLAGGVGYIGSHVARELMAAEHQVVVLDDLSSGDPARLPEGAELIEADIADSAAVRQAMRAHRPAGVVHLAARKAVEESVRDPWLYYRQNVAGLVSLLEAMRAEDVQRLVFSSSAAVYGSHDAAMIDETASTRPDSPYGRSKLIGEQMIGDAVRASGLSAVSLRYFNVVGCAEPALADVAGANLFPSVISRIARGLPVSVFGSDFPTPDGTCVRDYIHVQDLARAHVAAAGLAQDGEHHVLNVGCGTGHSVLDVLDAFSDVCGSRVPRSLDPRRPGDPAAMVADARQANRLLGWQARFGLDDMVASSWRAAVARGLVTAQVQLDGAAA